jgi:hypothetical protein
MNTELVNHVGQTEVHTAETSFVEVEAAVEKLRRDELSLNDQIFAELI